jgi:hypothetical protein
MEPQVATVEDYVNEVERMIAHYEKVKVRLVEDCQKEPLDISNNFIRYLRANEVSAVLIALKEVRTMFPNT